MADEVAQGIREGLDLRPESDFAWEWPTGAIRGWRGQAVQRLLKKSEISTVRSTGAVFMAAPTA